MTVSMREMRTQVRTVLDDAKNPDAPPKFMLTMVQGVESFSLPYTIDLQMYAKRDREVRPETLINTPVKVRIRIENLNDDRPFRFVERRGVIQNFSQQPRLHRHLNEDFQIFTARVVPAFLIMAQEVRYRVFENKSAVDVIEACMTGFQGINLGRYVTEESLAALKTHDDLTQAAEHAVQYGESTFNFLSRLMNRSSIWYTFEHPTDNTLGLERMVLGFGPITPAQKAAEFSNFVDPRNLSSQGKRKTWQMVTGAARVYTPSPKLFRVGEFNTVQPTMPFQSLDGGKTTVADGANIINRDIGTEPLDQKHPKNRPTTSFIQESFPDPGAGSDENTTNDAQTAIEIAEAQVEVLTAMSGNASLMVGKSFGLTGGKDELLPDKTYLVTQLSYAAYERNYLYILRPNDIGGLGALVDDLFVQPIASFLDGFDSTAAPDPTTAMAATGMVQYGMQWASYAGGLKFSIDHYNGRNPSAAVASYTGQVASVLATATAGYVGAFVPMFYSLFQDLLPIIEAILDVVIDIVSVLVSLVGAIPLAIVSLVQLLLGHEAVLAKWPALVKEARIKVQNFIHPFFKPKFVDGFAASFNATAVDRPGQRAGAGIPLPTAQKTVIYGPHLATVIGKDGVGKAAADFGKLHHDLLGRVRLRFPWDRSPAGVDAAPKGGDKEQYLVGSDSVWARVSDNWAGAGRGTQFLPRIGDEVVVSFIDGDPDRPLVTGRVYNPGGSGGSNLPFPSPQAASVKAPDDLTKVPPTADLTRSGVRTRLVGQSAKQPEGFHMVRFEDKYDDAQMLLRADGRLDVTAFRTAYHTTHGLLHTKVLSGKDKDGKTYGGGMFTSVAGEYDLSVGDSRYEDVTKDYNLTVKAQTVFDLQADAAIMVKGMAALNAHDVVIEARNKITLKVGGSFVVLTPAMVQIKGAIVQINSGGAPADSPSPKITDAAGAATADPGEPWDWIAKHPPGKGGGSRTRTVNAQHGAQVVLGKDGLLAIGRFGKVKVSPSDPDFANNVVADVQKGFERDPAGVTALNSENSPTVIAQKPNPPTNPPSAHTTTDQKGNNLVVYDPKDWPKPNDPGSPTSDQILQSGMNRFSEPKTP